MAGMGGGNKRGGLAFPWGALGCAGLTEDKADVNARVEWSKVGINLRTNTPMPQMLRDAVRTVLDTDMYRLRASFMAEEFRLIDTRNEILRAIGQVSRNSAPLIHAALTSAE